MVWQNRLRDKKQDAGVLIKEKFEQLAQEMKDKSRSFGDKVRLVACTSVGPGLSKSFPPASIGDWHRPRALSQMTAPHAYTGQAGHRQNEKCLEEDVFQGTHSSAGGRCQGQPNDAAWWFTGCDMVLRSVVSR